MNNTIPAHRSAIAACLRLSLNPQPSTLNSPRALCGFLLIATITTAVTADEKKESPIAESSNLSAALPPGEWSRVEGSIDKGLAWLASKQEKDGRFPGYESAQPAITSMGIMAFLARGHLPDEGKYGRQISRAIDFVLATQKRRGFFSLLPVAPPSKHLSPSQTVTYNHAIAGLMLGEVYGMTSGTRSKRIEAALGKALIYHREVQTRPKKFESDKGGWRYGYPEKNASSDMSVTGWALMFLRSARNAEFNVPKSHFDEGLDFVERCYEPDTTRHERGVFLYLPRESSTEPPRTTLPNTSSAILTLILGGRQDHEGISVGVDWLTSKPYPRLQETNYFYLSSYYTSQAVAQVGGETWNKMFPQIARNMMDAQMQDGSFRLGAHNEGRFGQAYTTSLAILALTPAYQLLPIYQR